MYKITIQQMFTFAWYTKRQQTNPIKMAESELIHQTHCQMKTL